MAENDNYRVEARLGLSGAGLAGSPEHIEKLRARQAEHARQTGKPEQPFSAVLRKRRPTAAAQRHMTEKEKRLAALPRKGPRPTAHPSRRRIYGDDDVSDVEGEDGGEGGGGSVVLKG